MTSKRPHRFAAYSVVDTQTTRPDVPPPATIYDLVALFARALDEGPAISRMHR